jgi:hypothetical protein
MGLPEDRVLGREDVARRLGLSRQRISQLQRDDQTFPRSGIGYRDGIRLWEAAGIECWAAAHRPARSEAAGRFAGEAGALLLGAEARALRIGSGWLDSGHFWLAVAEGDAGPALAAVLASMGVAPDEIEQHLEAMRGSDDTRRRTRRMTPRLQTFLRTADRRASDGGRDRVSATDILLAFIDGKRERDHRRVLRPADHLMSSLERRGLDIEELRRRLVATEADSASVRALEPRPLKPRRKGGRSRKPGWLDLAPNPLGHDPWTRRPWGAAFSRTRDGRSLMVDGEQWFFLTDGDGFYVRAYDGRPVGYRWRVQPKPRLRPVNGLMEILPMPPVEMDHWPDGRYTRED